MKPQKESHLDTLPMDQLRAEVHRLYEKQRQAAAAHDHAAKVLKRRRRLEMEGHKTKAE